VVGLQCKACGHRVLISREPTSPSERFMMDHEIMDKLRQSPQPCDQCGATDVLYVSMTSSRVDEWLGPPPRS
jgi:hypothetical protein